MATSEPGWFEGLVAAVLAIGGGVVAWRKSRSQDSTDEAKDRAEVDVIDSWKDRAEAAEARASASEVEAQRVREKRTADAGQIALLRAENEYLKRFYKAATRDMPDDKRKVWETDFSPLGGDIDERK